MSDDQAEHWIQTLAEEIAERAAASPAFGISPVAILRKHIIDVLLDRYRNLPELDIKIARLSLKPGDVLVLKTNHKLTVQQVKDLGNSAKRFLPDNEVMVVSWGIDTAVKELDWASL